MVPFIPFVLFLVADLEKPFIPRPSSRVTYYVVALSNHMFKNKVMLS